MDFKSKVRQNITAWPELGINYWGIHKNASSTMIMHLCTLTGTITPTEEEIEEGMLGKTTLVHSHRYITQEEAFENGLINFAITRHPLDRFISIYKHLKYPKTPAQENTRRKIKMTGDFTPMDFLEHVATTFRTGKKINKHWDRQVANVPMPWILDHVIKLENLIEDWPLDIEPPAIKSNSTGNEDVDIDERLIYDVYHQDYTQFGYQPKVFDKLDVSVYK